MHAGLRVLHTRNNAKICFAHLMHMFEQVQRSSKQARVCKERINQQLPDSPHSMLPAVVALQKTRNMYTDDPLYMSTVSMSQLICNAMRAAA